MKRIREAAIVLPQSPALQSLFLSLFPYTDANVKPNDEIVHLKMQEAVYCLLDTDVRFYPTLFDFNEAWKIDLLPFMEANCTQDMTFEEFATLQADGKPLRYGVVRLCVQRRAVVCQPPRCGGVGKNERKGYPPRAFAGREAERIGIELH